MDTSKFIAKILGLSFLAGGLGYVVSGQHYRKIFEGFSEPSVSTFLFSIGLIVAGMAIVKYHNIWQGNWRIWITLYGWLCLVKGTLFMIFPNFLSNYIHLIEEVPDDYFLGAGVVNMLIGLMFGYFGFLHDGLKNTKEVVT
ncbi:MAG: hypothetical protein OEM26_15685 [Saprospiraceae bacterium]|nr:hypothetical protein [Saprospiraceae bacterium]